MDTYCRALSAWLGKSFVTLFVVRPTTDFHERKTMVQICVFALSLVCHFVSQSFRCRRKMPQTQACCIPNSSVLCGPRPSRHFVQGTLHDTVHQWLGLFSQDLCFPCFRIMIHQSRDLYLLCCLHVASRQGARFVLLGWMHC